MTKTEEIATKAKIIVDGIAFTKNDNWIYAVNLHCIKYRAKFSENGKLIATNMSDDTIKKIKDILKDNMEFL